MRIKCHTHIQELEYSLNSNSKKLGIFICTRKNIDNLQRLLKSVFSLCNNKDNIEVWIGFDEDDSETEAFIKQSDFKLNSYINTQKSAVCSQSNVKYVNRHKDVIQPMVDQCEADYLWVLNDDLIIKTEDFDRHIQSSIETFLENKNDRIFYGMVEVFIKDSEGILRTSEEDTFLMANHASTYARYPILTKESVQAIGYLLPTSLPASGADIVLGAGFARSIYSRKHKIAIVLYDMSPSVKDELYTNRTEYHVQDKQYIEYNEIINIANKLDSAAGEADSITPLSYGLFVSYKCNSCGVVYNDPFYEEQNLTVCPNCTHLQKIDFGIGKSALLKTLYSVTRQLRGLTPFNKRFEDQKKRDALICKQVAFISPNSTDKTEQYLKKKIYINKETLA